MRILISCDPFIPVPPRAYGGIERIVDGLVRALVQRGHEVALVAHPESTAPTARFFPWPSDGKSSLGHFRNIRAFQRALASFRPDVIHNFARVAYLLPALLGRTPLIMSYQRDISLRNARVARLMSRSRIAFTACSERLARIGSSSGGQWHGIPNFVDPEQFDFAPAVAADAPLLFLSRLDRVKGADRAIQLALKSGVPLVIAGNRSESGPERAYFDETIAPYLDGDRIQWIGPVDDRQKNYWLGRARAMIVPIRWEEPFGIVFAEALACGTPVISTPRGALPEIIEHGVHGFLAEDDASLLEAIRLSSTIDRAACRSRVEEHFSVNRVVNRYEALYRRLVLDDATEGKS